MRGPRVLLHAINGVGLGHLSRMVAVATAIRARAPSSSLCVLTSAGDTAMIARAGLEAIRLPPGLAEPHADVHRSARSLPPSMVDEAYRVIVDALAPDLVVADTHAPRALVEASIAKGARVALVQRALRREAMQELFKGPTLAPFDLVIVPDEPFEVPLGGAPSFVRVVPCGPIVRDDQGGEPAAAGEGPLVLVSAGGGGQPLSARAFCDACCDAHWLARAALPGLRTVLVTGPYGHVPAAAARYEGLEVRVGAGSLGALYRESDLVVAQAGYNTIAELRALAKPAVIVPGERRNDDQRARAEALADSGAAVLARPEAASIARAIVRALGTPGRLERMAAAHRAACVSSGNNDAAAALLSLVEGPRGEVRRVALVAHDYLPRKGGMETVAAETARGLAALGVEVEVLCGRRLGAVGGVSGKVRTTPMLRLLPDAAPIDVWGDLLRVIAHLAGQPPDVVHLCNAGLAPWAPLLIEALGRPVTVTAHGNDLVAPWVHDATAPEHRGESVRAGLGAASRVFAVSSFTRALSVERGARTEATQVVHNGVDTQVFCPGEREGALDEALGLDEGCQVLLTVARLADRKGHGTVIRALARLAPSWPRLRYVVTGEREGKARELVSLARELGVEQRVVFAGVVPQAGLVALYRRADVFVLVPDESERDVEGFGVALLEASACGVPVIGATVGGVPEAVGPAGLLVSPGDDEALAAAIEGLLRDPARRRELGDAGVRWAAEHAWDRVAKAYLDGMVDAVHSFAHLPPCSHRPQGPHESPFAGVRAARGLVAGAVSGADLRRLARRHAAGEIASADERRARLRRTAARGKVAHLRAARAGAALLPEALDDCRAAGVRPTVELRLRAFIDDAARGELLRAAQALTLRHGVPSADARALLLRIASLSPDELRKVRGVRLHLTDAAQADDLALQEGILEAASLRAAFARASVPVSPPPEVTRYLSTTPRATPPTAMIEPTNLCNLGCPTCPTGKGLIKPLPEMPPDRFARALEGLLPALRTLSLWNYGEPTLHRRLHELIAHAKARGVRVVKVSSNVHFLDGERAALLLASGLDVLILSVDGASPETYARFRDGGDFDRVARAVEHLCREKHRLGLARPRIELQFIVMRHNEHELSRMHELARQWGVDRLRIKTVGIDGDENRDLVPTSRLLSRYRGDGKTPSVYHPLCRAPWDTTVINVDGSVTPCCYLRPDMGDAHVMGNVFERPFVEIWRGDRYQAFRRAMLAGRGSMPVCASCRGAMSDLFTDNIEVAR